MLTKAGVCNPCRGSSADARLTVGSVKSCYGHTEGTAGLTGSLLAMQSLVRQVKHPIKHCVSVKDSVCQGLCMSDCKGEQHDLPL